MGTPHIVPTNEQCFVFFVRLPNSTLLYPSPPANAGGDVHGMERFLLIPILSVRITHHLLSFDFTEQDYSASLLAPLKWPAGTSLTPQLLLQEIGKRA